MLRQPKKISKLWVAEKSQFIYTYLYKTGIKQKLLRYVRIFLHMSPIWRLIQILQQNVCLRTPKRNIFSPYRMCATTLSVFLYSPSGWSHPLPSGRYYRLAAMYRYVLQTPPHLGRWYWPMSLGGGGGGVWKGEEKKGKLWLLVISTAIMSR